MVTHIVNEMQEQTGFSTPGYIIPKRTESIRPHKNLYTNVDSDTIQK